MAFDDLARGIGGFEDAHHARLRFQHRAHVHDFGEARDIRPGHQFADLVGLEIGAGDFEPGRSRHAGRRLHDEAQRQIARRLDRVADAVEAEHIGEFVRVPEDRGGALRHHHRA